MLLWLLGQIDLVLGDGGVVARQPFADRQARRCDSMRLGRATRLAQQDADVVVALGQIALVLGDGRSVAGQPLADLHSAGGDDSQRLCRPARVAQQVADAVEARGQVALVLR